MAGLFSLKARMADLDITGRVVVDASQAEGAFQKVGAASDKMAKEVANAAGKAGQAVDKIGDGAEKGEQKFTRSQSRMRDEIVKSTNALNLLGKTASEKLEFKIAAKGLDPAQFAPYIAELKRVEAAQRSVATSSKEAGSSFMGMGAAAGMAARAVAAIGIGVSVKEFIRLADASTNVASRLGLVTSSAAELASVQERLFTVAQKARVSFVDLVGTYSQLARSTKELGVSQGALLGVVNTISQAVTISGGSAQSAQAALIQLSQGFAAGALRGDELNSILEQTPRLAQAIADGLGVSVGKLRELGAAGELTAEKVLGALEKSAGTVSGEFEKMAVTVEQASTKAANSVLKLVGAMDKLTGASGTVSSAISLISQGVDFLTRDIEKLSGQGALRTAAREVLNLDNAAKNLRAGMENGVFNPNAEAQLARINARLAEAKARFNEVYTAMNGGKTDPRDQSGFTTRTQSYAAEAARQTRLADDANKFRLSLSGIPSSYIKDMNELIRLNQAGVIVGKEYTDALKKQQDAILKKTEATGRAVKSSNAEQTAYESLIASIRGKIEADKLELAGGSALTESQKLRVKLDQDLLVGRLKLSATNEKTLRAALDELAASEGLVAADKERAKVALELTKTMEDYAKAQTEGVASSISAAQAAETQLAQYGLLKSEVAGLTLEYLEQSRASASLAGEDVSNIDKRIAAQKRLIAATRGLESRELADKAQKDMEADWQKTADSINTSLTDALLRGFESGKDFAKNLRDTVVNMFKTMVLRPVISAIISPISGAITGALGLAGAANAGQSGVSNLLSGAGLLGKMGAFGGGLSAGFGGLTGSLGLTATGTTLGGALSAGTTALGAGNIMGGLGTIAGALGPIAIGIGLLTTLIKKSTPHMGGGSSYSALDGLTTGAEQYTTGNYGLADTRKYDATVGKLTADISRSIVGILDSTAAAFGKDAGYYAATAFADDSSKDGAWGSLLIKRLDDTVTDWADTQTSKWAPKEFADGEAGSKEYMAAIASSTKDAILSIGLPEWAERIAKAMPDGGSLDDLAATLEQIKNYPNELLQAYGSGRDELVNQFVQGLQSGDAAGAGQSVADSLVAGIQNAIYTNAAGQIFDIVNQGIVTPMLDAIATGASVSEALSQATIDATIERAKAQAETLSALFGNAEFTGALEQIRTAVGSALGQAGASIQRIPYVAQQIDTAAQSAATAAQAAQDAWQRITDGLLSARLDADIALLRAMGKEEEALAAERTRAITGFDAYQVALFDGTQAILAQITALEKQAELQRTIADELPGVIDAYLTPMQRLKNGYDKVASDLNASGFSGISGDALASASKDQIAAAAVAAYNLGTTTDEMRLALIRGAGALATMKDAALDMAMQGTDAAFSVLQQQVDKQKQALIEALNLSVAATDAALSALEKDIAGRKAALTNALGNATQDTDKAAQALEREASARRQVLQETISDTRAVFQAVGDAARSLYADVASTATAMGAQGSGFIADALATAQSTGYLPDSAALQKAISGATQGIGGTQYGSQFESDRARLVLAGQLQGLETIADSQATEAEKQLSALNELTKGAQDQLEAMRGVDKSVLGVDERIKRLTHAIGVESDARSNASEANLAALDSIIENAREQVNALRGVGSNILSLSDALAKEATARAGASTTALAALDAIVSNAQEEINLLRGLDGGVTTLAGAVAALAEAVGMERVVAGKPPAGSFTSSTGNGYYNPATESGVNNAGASWTASALRDAAMELAEAGNTKAVYDAIKDAGFTLAQGNAILGIPDGSSEEWARAMGLPVFHNGTSYVPRTGLALLEQGEAVIPRSLNRGNDDTVQELRAMRMQNTEMLARMARMEEHARRTASATNGNPDQPVPTAVMEMPA